MLDTLYTILADVGIKGAAVFAARDVAPQPSIDKRFWDKVKGIFVKEPTLDDPALPVQVLAHCVHSA